MNPTLSALPAVQPRTLRPTLSRKPRPDHQSATTQPDLGGELVLIRGLPGSGKSTLARELADNGYLHFEADMFFEVGGTYRYDASKIRDAHSWCQRMTRQALGRGEKVVVSNTFTQLREMEPYLAMSKDVRVVEAKGRWQNQHAVPEAMLERMAQRWEVLPARLKSN